VRGLNQTPVTAKRSSVLTPEPLHATTAHSADQVGTRPWGLGIWLPAGQVTNRHKADAPPTLQGSGTAVRVGMGCIQRDREKQLVCFGVGTQLKADRPGQAVGPGQNMAETGWLQAEHCL
jgi:hypothetical protein